jgi:hypothetical protein
MRITHIAKFLGTSAVACAGLLLVANLPAGSLRADNAWLSALPLALVGIGYALLQIPLKPNRTTLLKRLLLAAAFVFWAVDQMLPPGRLATFIGDAVISAYVVDLFWMMQDQNEIQRDSDARSAPDGGCFESPGNG